MGTSVKVLYSEDALKIVIPLLEHFMDYGPAYSRSGKHCANCAYESDEFGNNPKHERRCETRKAEEVIAQYKAFRHGKKSK